VKSLLMMADYQAGWDLCQRTISAFKAVKLPPNSTSGSKIWATASSLLSNKPPMSRFTTTNANTPSLAIGLPDCTPLERRCLLFEWEAVSAVCAVRLKRSASSTADTIKMLLSQIDDLSTQLIDASTGGDDAAGHNACAESPTLAQRAEQDLEDACARFQTWRALLSFELQGITGEAHAAFSSDSGGSSPSPDSSQVEEADDWWEGIQPVLSLYLHELNDLDGAYAVLSRINTVMFISSALHKDIHPDELCKRARVSVLHAVLAGLCGHVSQAAGLLSSACAMAKRRTAILTVPDAQALHLCCDLRDCTRRHPGSETLGTDGPSTAANAAPSPQQPLAIGHGAITSRASRVMSAAFKDGELRSVLSGSRPSSSHVSQYRSVPDDPGSMMTVLTIPCAVLCEFADELILIADLELAAAASADTDKSIAASYKHVPSSAPPADHQSSSTPDQHTANDSTDAPATSMAQRFAAAAMRLKVAHANHPNRLCAFVCVVCAC